MSAPPVVYSAIHKAAGRAVSRLCLVQFLKNPEAVSRGMVSEVVPATCRRLCE